MKQHAFIPASMMFPAELFYLLQIIVKSTNAAWIILIRSGVAQNLQVPLAQVGPEVLYFLFRSMVHVHDIVKNEKPCHQMAVDDRRFERQDRTV